MNRKRVMMTHPLVAHGARSSRYFEAFTDNVATMGMVCLLLTFFDAAFMQSFVNQGTKVL